MHGHEQKRPQYVAGYVIYLKYKIGIIEAPSYQSGE
jgi:hypothetical protein